MAKKSAFTIRADGRIQTKVKLPGMDKPKYFYGESDQEVIKKIALFKQDVSLGRCLVDIIEQWEKTHYEEISYNTMRSYLSPIQEFKWEFGESRASEVAPQELKRFVDLYAKKGYGKKTVKNMMSVMRMIFDYAVLMGDINISPMTAVKLPTGLTSSVREMPSDKEIEIIKNSVELPFGLFPYFLIYTGCRPSEALAVRHEDIDRINKTITISKAVHYPGSNQAKLKLPKTERGIRETLLLEKLEKVLPEGEGYIFGNDNPLSKKAYNYRWGKYKKIVGVNLTPYQLRHAYATMLFEAGIDEKDAQELMGHAHISTTHNIYTHIRKQKKQGTLNTLNNFDF